MKGVKVEGSGLFHQWKTIAGDQYFLLGTVVGIRQADGLITPSSNVKIETERLENPLRIPDVEGRFILVKISGLGVCEVWTDRFGRTDVYWQTVGDSIVLASSLDLLPVATIGGEPDCIGVAHSLTVYGSRPAKQHTLYKGIARLGVNQGVKLENGACELLKRPVKLLDTQQYDERDLDRYSDLFLEALRARASNDGNVVFLSSGWDSTSILAGLVHLVGKGKVRAVIGRHLYADRSGVINPFEIDRATAMADYFGIKLDVVDLDYRQSSRVILEEAQDVLRSQQLANMTSINHWLMTEHVAKTANGDEVIFAGEMSDGAHNLGFSQFVSIFHPASYEFREYSDKMASYLFGPTFLRQLFAEKQNSDPVWNLYKGRRAGSQFDELGKGKHTITKQLLASFFLRADRFPLSSMENVALLTPQGREFYSDSMESAYLEDILDQVTPDNLYSAYLHLYNSFHWQGATVSSFEYMAEEHGLQCVLPYHDGAIIDFLSAMPESWGRGLDLNPTKYPLKWMLKNRIDYPYHLQVGAHSYIYDVDPNFSHTAELLYGSHLKGLFNKAFQKNALLDWIGTDLFDQSYMGELIQQYQSGDELRGVRMNDLSVLAFHSAIGFYGE